MVLKSAGWRLAKGERRTIAAALCSVLLASCTSAGDPTMSVGMPGYNATASDISAASSAQPATAADSSSQITDRADDRDDGERHGAFPRRSPMCRWPSPQAAFPLTTCRRGADTIAGQHAAVAAAAGADGARDRRGRADRLPPPMPGATAPKPATAAPAMNNPVYVTAARCHSRRPTRPRREASWPRCSAPRPPRPRRAADQHQVGRAARSAGQAGASTGKADHHAGLGQFRRQAGAAGLDRRRDRPHHWQRCPARRAPDGAVRDQAQIRPRRRKRRRPATRTRARRGAYQVASAAGMARLAPNGLLKQNESVDVACLKPSLVRVLKTDRGPLRPQDDGDVRLSRPGPQPPRQRRQEFAAHVLRRRRHPGSRRLASGNWRAISAPCPAAAASAPTATPNPCTSTSAPSATGTGAAVAADSARAACRSHRHPSALAAKNFAPRAPSRVAARPIRNYKPLRRAHRLAVQDAALSRR